MNVRIYYLSLILCTLCYYGKAQTTFHKPDYTVIKAETSDESKITYYPKLLKRYMDNDTTLTTGDYVLLYYGYSLQPEYNSTLRSPEMDSARLLLNNTNLTTGQAQVAIELLKKAFKKDPFNIRTLFFLFNVYNHTQNTIDAQAAIKKATGLVKALLTTGDGKTEATAIDVLHVSDEYMLINFLSYTPNGIQELGDKHYDILGLQDNNDDQKNMYFDIATMMQNEAKMFSQPQGNGIKWH